ncbi:MAG TPA: lipase family protein [Pseudonocardiaceae bacterium]
MAAKNGVTVVQDGVTIHDAVAPSYRALRPLSDKSKGVFPVYKNLTEKLLKPEQPVDPERSHPDKTVAHVLATCAAYSYSEADTVATMMARMGLKGNRCRAISENVDAMFIASTAYVVQSADGRVVIVAYRGTQPTNLITWLTDVDLHPDKVEFNIGGRGPYDVHAGFYRNVRATRYKVAEVLDRARHGFAVTDPPDSGKPERVNPMEALYVTGHSLGGAMAALMGIMIRTEDSYRDAFGSALQAVYTFAQPMIGSNALADACTADSFLKDNVIRYVYQRDPAPHTPPRDTGGFKHFGREYQFIGDRWRKNIAPARQAGSVLGILGVSVAAFIAHQFPLLGEIPFRYQFDDHGPQHYIRALTPPGVTTEFGDQTYAAAKPTAEGSREYGSGAETRSRVLAPGWQPSESVS